MPSLKACMPLEAFCISTMASTDMPVLNEVTWIITSRLSNIPANASAHIAINSASSYGIRQTHFNAARNAT